MVRRSLRVLLGALVLAAGCASTEEGPDENPVEHRVRTSTKKDKPDDRIEAFDASGPTFALDSKAKNNVGDLGLPKVLSQLREDLGPVALISRDGYVLLHSNTQKIPLWVCEKVTKHEVTGPLERPDVEPFHPEPEIEKGSRAELSDYFRSGFDRGHMAPSGNQTQNETWQAETFYLSNMVPQVGVTFNRGIWKALEFKVRDWAVARGTVYTITGPMFYDPEEDDPATADGSIPYDVIGKNSVAVPTHCFKVVASKGTNGWEVIAFVLPNGTYHGAYKLEKYLRSVDWIEERVGFDLLSGLPDDTEKAIEKKQATALWN